MRIAVIGGGNMGLAFAEGIASSESLVDPDIYVVEPDVDRRAEISKIAGLSSVESISKLSDSFDAVLLAVKPQVVPSLYTQIKQVLGSNTTVISVMAGITVSEMVEQLGEVTVIRAMPNLPARVGKGVTVACIGSEVLPEQQRLVEAILSGAGEVLFVESEVLLDAATAVSGSGPGFVFYLIDHFQMTAKQLGFSSLQAELLVRETFAGALELLRTSELSAAELRKQVTSKGGTTEAGLQNFEKNKLGSHLQEGIRAAFDRSCELGKGK